MKAKRKNKPMKVTRIAFGKSVTASKLSRLREIAHRLGVLRSKIWDEFGSLNGLGKTSREIRDGWMAANEAPDNVPARLWKATLADTFADIQLYMAAAKAKVRKEIKRRAKDPTERKRLFTLLKSDQWLDDPFLRRRMRKHFKHGHTKVRNQIILDTGCYKAFEYNGRAWVEVMSLLRGHRIAIPLNTTYQPVKTLRLILRQDNIEVHYAVDSTKVCASSPCGEGVCGVDKGYTEAFTDSDGVRHGEGLGKVLSTESDALKSVYLARNKLRAIAEAKPHKADKIRANNLGRKKLDERKRKHTSRVKDKIHKAVHSVVDKYGTIVVEDLTAVFKSTKPFSKNMKRRLSGWVKGILAVALLQVSQRRGASLVLVNAAYTSQTDHRNGCLLGERRGDRFYCFDGVVLDADENAAQNIKARLEDDEISLWTPFQKIKAILLRRTELFNQRLGLLNPGSSCVPA